MEGKAFAHKRRSLILRCAAVGGMGLLLIISMDVLPHRNLVRDLMLDLGLGIGCIGGTLFLLYRLLAREHAAQAEAELISGKRYEAFKAAVAAAPVAIVALDRNGLVQYWSPVAAQIFGRSEREAVGHPLPLDPVSAAHWVERGMAGELRAGFDTTYTHSDGSTINLRLRVAPVHAPGGGVSGVMAAIADTTHEKQVAQGVRAAQQRALALAEVSRHLANVDLDLMDRLGKVVKVLAPLFADWCVLDLVKADGSLHRLAVAHVDRAKGKVAEGLKAADLADPLWQARMEALVAHPEGLLQQIIGGHESAGAASDSPLVEFLRQQGVTCTSAITMSIQVRGRLLGLITMVHAESGRVYTLEDLSLARDVALRLGALLEADRLLQEAQEVGRELQGRVAELHGLWEAAVAINSDLRLDQMLQVISDQARTLIGAHLSGAALVAPEGGLLDMVAYSRTDKHAAFDSYHSDTPLTGAGIHNWIMKHRVNVRLTQAQLEAHRAFENFGPDKGKHPPLRGLLAVPLLGRNGEPLGFIQVSDRYVGEFTEHDERLLAHFGRLAAIAVENGRLHDGSKKAEARLRTQADLLTAITDSMAEAVMGLDEAGRVTFANRTAQELIGRTEVAFLGHCLHDLIGCDRSELGCSAGTCMVMQVLQTGNAQLARETLFSRQDGSFLPVAYSATPIKHQGAVTGAVLSFTPLVSRSGLTGWRTAEDIPKQ